MSEKDLHNSFEDLSIVGNCSSKELKECLKRIEKLETENKKIELIEETIKSLKKENTSDEKFKLIEKNFYKLFNRYTTIYDEKLENENKLKKENEKIQIEKNLLEKQVEQLQNENKKISDLFEKFTNKKIEETENLKTQIEESLNKNNEKLNEEQDLNALINKKYKEIEENKKNEKMIGQTNKLVKEQYTQLNKELVQLYSNFLKKAVYVSLPNKINEVGNEYSFETCCDKKCINSNLLNGSCISKYSYVNVNEDGFIKYYLGEKYSYSGMGIKLYA